MAQPYWNPTSLLQFDGALGCRGIIEGSFQCSFPGKDRQRKIRRVLDQLSRERPEHASIATLETLASLSICGRHDPYSPLLEEWIHTIRSANDHHQYLLQFDLADVHRELNSSETKHLQTSREFQDHIISLRLQLSKKDDEIKNAVVAASNAKTRWNATERAMRVLEKKTATTTAQLSEIIEQKERLENEAHINMDELGSSKADVDRLRRENKAMVEKIDAFEKEGIVNHERIVWLKLTLEKAVSSKQQLEAHLGSRLRAKDVLLTRYDTDLPEAHTSCEILGKRIEDLESINAELRDQLSRTYWHVMETWITSYKLYIADKWTQFLDLIVLFKI